MDKYKILIIDDSALMRSVMSDIINKDNRFMVADKVFDGVQGLDLLIKSNGKYDLVLLDVNMPKMNGLEVLKKIRKYNLKCKVIMVSTLVKEGATETILALENGAIDFVLKPSNTRGEMLADFLKRLMESIVVAVGLTDDANKSNHKIINSKNLNSSRNPKNGNKIVAIACSTGGPKSLKEVIPLLPSELDAPVVLVQHMPAGFTKSLANRLDELSKVKVIEAGDGDILKKGYIYIAPGGKHMRVVHEVDGVHSIKLTDEAPREGLKPCANIMYESLIDSKYDNIVCVVLTGMGSDGTNGIEKLSKSKEIYVISQDAETSVVYGMPRAVTNAGLSDKVLPLDKVSEAIIKNVGVLSDGR